MTHPIVPKTPLVSVCIPVRNGERELPLTLSNLLLHGSYPRDSVEVLVGDHGSSDGTARVLSEARRDFDQVRSVSVPYDGPNRAKVRNRLLSACRGEVVVFIDHDVLAQRDFVAEHVRVHERFPGSLVAGETFGKGFFKQEIEALLRRLDLADVTSALPSLVTTPDLADVRTRAAMLPGWTADADVTDLAAEPAAFRFFWTCNVSARRCDIDDCGTFDERYSGWGIEDDDFAQQFRSRGKGLLFSRRAWGLHVPHPADTYKNLCAWRTNFDRFFDKWRTRELEYYALFTHEVGSAAKALEWVLGAIDQVTPAVPALPRRGRRMAHFVGNAEAARALDLTDALNPYVGIADSARTADGIRYWPFFGLRTAFQDLEIDETILDTDRLMLLDRHALALLWEETARVSARVIVAAGPRFSDPDYASNRRTLVGAIERLRFGEVLWP